MSYTIGNLREACRNDRIRWSMHAMKRLRERADIARGFHKLHIYRRNNRILSR